ncbi:MAG TPA: uroporphyrinogen-III synthase, partial [Planctomicrobium sp.]|nr:uroporphyrinogen-III synthase [Planctomicrobium sp.]
MAGTEKLLTVCSFESRRQEEMSRLIEKLGGIPVDAPSMREIPLSNNAAPFQFADELLADRIDLVVFMTGVGATALIESLATQGRDQAVLEKLRTVPTAARGPKPVAALSKLDVRVQIRAPEPNTWQDLAAELQRLQFSFSGKMVAVQEYGEASNDFYDWLRSQGADVLPVPVYKWALPEDVGPLEQAIQRTISGDLDILLWTSAQQLNHVLEIAERMGLREEWLQAARQNCVIGSIGPTASERLRSFNLPPDLEPSHPKMAHLIRESIEYAKEHRISG